jgi:hypothetical protein
MPTTPDPFPAAAAASNPRCTAADVKADRRSPAGPGLETGEDQRTLTKAEATPAASPDHRHNPRSARADVRALARCHLCEGPDVTSGPATLKGVGQGDDGDADR